MNIRFKPPALPASGTFVLLTNSKELGEYGKQINKRTKGALARAVKSQGFEGKKETSLSLLAPAHSKLERIVLLGVNTGGLLNPLDLERVGGLIASLCAPAEKTKTSAKAKAENNITVLFDIPSEIIRREDGDKKVTQLGAHVALGALLRHYQFDKYKTAAKGKKKPKITQNLVLGVEKPAASRKAFAPLKHVAAGICLARDLVNEPANVLTPPEFAKRTRTLTKLGVKVEVFGEAKLKQLGMGALLGVGQGSIQPSQLVVMQWQGAGKAQRPIAFIGKGVCFDTGGISIKPSPNMEDMRGDMGGAAAVTGLMHALAARKAKANVVGVIGLVENMPSGTAQRPGDIVKSMSGQTIEILNTDAEGRLVLADALWYTQKRFKPQCMIDLATLTGAILIALGQEYAGMFSNSDTLCKRLEEAGQVEGEKVWRMPLHETFDKMIDTPNADMKNIGGRYAGSSTAAQFLQRFVNSIDWAHLDIAGTAMGSPKSPINQSWGSGFGVKLLNRFVSDYYEE